MDHFQLISEFQPKGDQPRAISELIAGIERGDQHQVLLGVTGSGKTFTMACVISEINRPTLILAPNKTLAAQLYGEMKSLFPKNAVEYFVSYYDYYQPEAYVPARDLYIEKDSAINEAIDRLRHAATHSLLTRRDVIIVASVSCIYGLGSPDDYAKMFLTVATGDVMSRNDLLAKFVEMQYERSDADFHRGTFRVRGDVVEIFPAYEDSMAVRIEFLGDTIERIRTVDALTNAVFQAVPTITIHANSHFVIPEATVKRAVKTIRQELQERITQFHAQNKLVEEQRITQRTQYDLEMIEEIGFCKGIENYSRHLTGRKPGEPPPTLLDYFPRDFLCVVDESHVTIPQVGGMYNGDRARKMNLVEYGFRLPSALDNRPLKFDEFLNRVQQTVYVSATPAEFELNAARGVVVDQVVRPTGLLDPPIEIRPTEHQVNNLCEEIRKVVKVGDRVLVTTLTKRMAEDLTGYYQQQGIRVRYMHSDVETLERVALLRDLRKGVYDVLVGINLLREGLDLPEVSLVAILDADKEGFLRSERSLIQTFGRAARNVNGRVILYADKVTSSMQRAMGETSRRRARQEDYNRQNGITPETIKKEISDVLQSVYEQDYPSIPEVDAAAELPEMTLAEAQRALERLKKQMLTAAKNLEFEEAARIRDQISAIQNRVLAQ